ncbi:hypothetical protein BDV33DRAFT_186267 [Aspergillus novoparasiticus]|uniref:Uncharacterized protein n=1 Tax=Aspergillus novoparasiticus TaxID=986946 RepID=A0A5N6E7F7_9EURO|nr:hypothetical protein BDV33DRAFT_186267 [Aspergillus novoparasiticus]
MGHCGDRNTSSRFRQCRKLRKWETTGDTLKELMCKILDLAAWERPKAILSVEVEQALTQQVGGQADMASEVQLIMESSKMATDGFIRCHQPR